MPSMSLVLQDFAGGGMIMGPGIPTWTWNGKTISLEGDIVAPHGLPPHAAAVIYKGSLWMSINGIPVTRATSPATCGDLATGTIPVVIP